MKMPLLLSLPQLPWVPKPSCSVCDKRATIEIQVRSIGNPHKLVWRRFCSACAEPHFVSPAPTIIDQRTS